MGLSIRRERFLRVKERRLENALSAIESLENLSNKANYEFTQNEIDEMYGTLLAKLKNVFASFFSSSDREKYEQLIRADQLQYDYLRKNDPGVFSYVEQQLNHTTSQPPVLTENPAPDLTRFDDAIKSLVNELKNIDIKLSSINQEVASNTKKIKRMETHAQWEEHSAFILNPDFNMETIRDDFHLERLHWVRYGRTLKDINDPESPYSKTPNFTSPIDCLAWDIRQGRVIEMS